MMSSSSFVPVRSAEVKQHNGRPTLFVNNSPQSGLTYMTYNEKPENFAKFEELGVRVMSFTLTSDCSLSESWSAPVAVAPGKYDYSDLDARIEGVLKAAPNAWLLPRVYTVAPEWWCAQNEDEVTRYGAPREHPRPGIDVYHGRFNPSMASRAWRNFASDNMTRLIEHIQQKPWADHFLGFHFASGTSEEWVDWGTHDGYFPDYSPPMIRAFRDFLRQRYGADEALQEAWQRSDVTLATATIPTLEERVREPGGSQIRDPGESQNVVDYLLCHSYELVDTMLAIARAIKEGFSEPRITLAFSGSYFCTQCWQQYLLHNSGCLALERLLKSPYIDALTSPSNYMHRGAGTGHGSFIAPEASIALHGKLWFDENDIRTHPLGKTRGFGSTNTVDDTICIQRRQFSAVMQQGCAMWWFDMGGNWYDEPMHQEICQSVSIAQRALDLDRSSVSEIALVVDPESIAYMNGSTQIATLLIGRPRLSFGHCGAPCDMVLLNDLAEAKDYKLYVFLNVFHMNDEQRQMVDRVVRCDGKTAWWFHAAGYVGDTLDAGNISRTTGITIEPYPGHNWSDTEIRPCEHPILTGLDRTHVYGDSGWWMCPFFFAEDPEATTLGVWAGNEHLPTMVAKELDGWQSVWSMAPNPPAWLIRRVARWAGVHIYNELDEALYANASLLMVSTNHDGGPRTLKLPRRQSVHELFDRRRSWQDVKEFSIDLPRHHTGMFFLGTEDQWQAGMN